MVKFEKIFITYSLLEELPNDTFTTLCDKYIDCPKLTEQHKTYSVDHSIPPPRPHQMGLEQIQVGYTL